MRKGLAFSALLALLLAVLAVTPIFAQEPVTININPLPGETASGVATLTPMGNQTEVVVTMSGLTPGVHSNHIHTGTCDNIGGIVYPLTDLNADAQGSASATTMLDVPLSTIQSAQHNITVHTGPLPAPTIACGEIPVMEGEGMPGGTDMYLVGGLAAGVGLLLALSAILVRRRRA